MLLSVHFLKKVISNRLELSLDRSLDGATILNIMALNITTLNMTTLSIMTLSITALNIPTLSNDIEYRGSVVLMSVMYAASLC
jgi:hypothetical protein